MLLKTPDRVLKQGRGVCLDEKAEVTWFIRSPRALLLNRGFQGTGNLGCWCYWLFGWRKGWFRGASELAWKIKDDFQWFPARKQSCGLICKRSRLRGKWGHSPGQGPWSSVGLSCSGRRRRAWPPRAVQHQSQRGVRTALLTLSHSSHCWSQEEGSAEKSPPPQQLSQASTSLPLPSPSSFRKEIAG